jgi:hypothetical protein
MILTAHQPVYLPWLGLFHKIAISDLFCYFDIAQYQRKDFNNRNKIRNKTLDFWLSVPVKSKNHFDKTVGEIEIIQDGWQEKHIKSIRLAYQKTPFFNDYFPELELIIRGKSQGSLGELNLYLLKYFMRCLDISTPIVKASDYNFNGSKSDLVLDMCLKLNADSYIFGSQGEGYANIDKFNHQSVNICFQDYIHPVYRQTNRNFLSNLSIVDLLFNCGPDSNQILMSGNIDKVDLCFR